MMAITNKKSELKAKSDEMINFLKDIPYSKVDSYIDKNITNLQSAKTFLKKLTKLALYLIKQNQ